MCFTTLCMNSFHWLNQAWIWMSAGPKVPCNGQSGCAGRQPEIKHEYSTHRALQLPFLLQTRVTYARAGDGGSKRHRDQCRGRQLESHVQDRAQAGIQRRRGKQRTSSPAAKTNQASCRFVAFWVTELLWLKHWCEGTGEAGLASLVSASSYWTYHMQTSLTLWQRLIHYFWSAWIITSIVQADLCGCKIHGAPKFFVSLSL